MPFMPAAAWASTVHLYGYVTNVGALKHDFSIRGRKTRLLSHGQSETLRIPSSARVRWTPPTTGTFSFENQFVVQPGNPASCSFPVTFDLQVSGNFQLEFDSQGQPAKLLLHEHWTGTGAANGKLVIEHAAQTDLID